MTGSTRHRKKAVSDLKRQLILDAARAIFEQKGLEGASLRAIANAAGYTPAALYFHFDSKEDVYAALLEQSLTTLKARVEGDVNNGDAPRLRIAAAAMAFFEFYRENPKDLDLGFYLFQGGMGPDGVGRERNERLNAMLYATLEPIGQAGRDLGLDAAGAQRLMADMFAHATGVLLLAHTGRIGLFDVSPVDQMKSYINARIGVIDPAN